MRLALLAVVLLLAGCSESKPPPHTLAQIISAIPPWDRKVLDLATDEQLWLLLFFGGSVVGGAWWSLVKGLAEVVSAWRFPPAKEVEDEGD